MASHSRPRRGSLAYSPRKRASRPTARIRSWPLLHGEARILGFVGYKAGMTHVIMVDDRPRSQTEGQEISVPVTILETPPLHISAVRLYKETLYGKKTLYEIQEDNEKGFATLEEMVGDGMENMYHISFLCRTNPKLTNIPKKRPDTVEIAVGGDNLADKISLAEKLLGENVKIGEVFREGQFVDVTAVTKGKGLQGPVKRWGIKLAKRKHARSGKLRHTGTLGPWSPPRVMWTVPQAGQTGYHQRTEYNKRLLKIGENGDEITPKGGIVGYGIIRGEYTLLQGSVPGAKKRLIRLRHPVRPPKHFPEKPPEIVYVSLESQQGV